MAVLIRTEDIPPEQRHDAWRSVVCDTLGPLDFRSDPLTAWALDALHVARADTAPGNPLQVEDAAAGLDADDRPPVAPPRPRCSCRTCRWTTAGSTLSTALTTEVEYASSNGPSSGCRARASDRMLSGVALSFNTGTNPCWGDGKGGTW